MIEKPTLAATFDPSKAVYPYLATPKIDGIRFIIRRGVALSRSLKPIRNNYIREHLERFMPDGTDGELTCGNNFQDSTSAVMSIEGKPEFKAWVFDFYSNVGYGERIDMMFLRFTNICVPFQIKVLYPLPAKNLAEVVDLKLKFLEQGFEGIMLRSPNGPYKFGRSTLKENILLKWKEFVDEEATVIGFREKLHNNNRPEIDELGYVKRSTSKDGLVPAGTLGALIVKNTKYELSIGSGMDDSMRSDIWLHREAYIGRTAKYKYMPFGVVEKPRHPVFIGFRDADDL